MSRLSCKCGSTLGTSDSPSPYILYIYYDEEIQEALRYNHEISLRDFLMDWDELNDTEKIYTARTEPIEYWRCLDCGRIYEVQAIANGKKLRSYNPEQLPSDIPDYSAWKKIVIISDMMADCATEIYIDYTLSDFLSSGNSVNGWISDDEGAAIITKDDKLLFYRQE